MYIVGSIFKSWRKIKKLTIAFGVYDLVNSLEGLKKTL